MFRSFLDGGIIVLNVFEVLFIMQLHKESAQVLCPGPLKKTCFHILCLCRFIQPLALYQLGEITV